LKKKVRPVVDLAPVGDRRATILGNCLSKALFGAGAIATEMSGVKMSSRLNRSHVFGKARLAFEACFGVGFEPFLDPLWLETLEFLARGHAINVMMHIVGAWAAPPCTPKPFRPTGLRPLGWETDMR